MAIEQWFNEVKDIFGHMLGLTKEEADQLDINHWKQYYGYLQPIEAVKKEFTIIYNLLEHESSKAKPGLSNTKHKNLDPHHIHK
ncbi:MAG: hypothetical protein OEY59_09275 [Deltaproteobacteria bacterium]|nr:hypothetical protein [Deltaproteobacteria bacterium]